MKNNFLKVDNLINTVLAIFVAFVWWNILPNIAEKVLAVTVIFLLYIGAYFAGNYFDKGSAGINLRKGADKMNSEAVKFFKKIPVISSPSFWIFIISSFVSWFYYQDNKATVLENNFLIVLLFVNPFLNAVLFKIVEPLRDKMFSVKSLKDKIIWRVLTAVVVLILAGPYIYFAYNILTSIMEKQLI